MPSSASGRAGVYTLSLHDALPICQARISGDQPRTHAGRTRSFGRRERDKAAGRSEEHTSELQSLRHLVCRLLLRGGRESTLFPYTTLFRSAKPEFLATSRALTQAAHEALGGEKETRPLVDRKSTRLNSSHLGISYAVFCFGAGGSLHSFPTRRSSDLPSPNFWRPAAHSRRPHTKLWAARKRQGRW